MPAGRWPCSKQPVLSRQQTRPPLSSPPSPPAPDSGSPDLLDELPRLGDDVGSCETDDAGHLHGVPAGPGETPQLRWVGSPEGHRDQRSRGRERGTKEGLEQGRTKGEFSSVLRSFSVPISVCWAGLWKVLEGGSTMVHDLGLRGLSTPAPMVGVPVSFFHSPTPCASPSVAGKTRSGCPSYWWPSSHTSYLKPCSALGRLSAHSPCH